MPDVKLSQLAAASAASVAAGAGLWTMAGHILGLQMEYVGPASIRVSSGSAWIPSLQRAIEVPSALTLSGLTLAANTWYHLYLYLNGTTPALEVVADAPAAPYSGTARAKTGATSRRYLGSVLTKGDATIPNFICSAGYVTYRERTDTAPFRALANGVATTPVTVPLNACGVPITSRTAKLNVTNLATAGTMCFSTPDASTGNMQGVRPQSGFPILFPVDEQQQVTYGYTTAPSGGGGYIDVIGYAVER